MNKPTDEQIKEFWKRCGFRYKRNSDPLACVWEARDGRTWGYELPKLDLNNLFKYAVPKLQDRGNNVELYAYEHKGYMATAYKDCFSQRGSDGYEPFLELISQVKDDDPALALFWAIYKVIKSE